MPATPEVIYKLGDGDTLDSLWQDCYSQTFTAQTFKLALGVLNPSVNLANVRPGDQLRFPGGWGGANCPLSSAQPGRSF